MNDFTEQDTQNYYNSFGSVYEAVWNEEIHTGYFDTDKSLEQAVRDMDSYLAKLVNIVPNSTILTVGSGRGGVDRFLVRNFSAKITGLDLSIEQITKAKSQAQDQGMQESITYVQGPMIALPFSDSSFDILWVQESLFHCHDKQKAVSEFRRVLKLGGKLVLEDTVLGFSDAKEEVLATFGKRVRLNELLTRQEIANLFQSAGFNLQTEVDISKHLEITYGKIVEHIESSGEKLSQHLPTEYSNLDTIKQGFKKSQESVAQGKLGCIVQVYF
ncbi:MAG TPA: methyltransferase domain-containing protein [Patescibacteria group bacterium]|nr:methyltransferase domain-containing protein [Patescibacteria group bacterium]